MSATEPPSGTTDDLSEMMVEELNNRFGGADVPSVRDLSGNMEETVLAGRGALRSRGLRSVVNTPLNPWVGKRIEPYSEQRGEGANVFSFGPFERTTANFEVSVKPSVFDGEDTLLFDYDLPDNTTPTRRVIDEVRVLDTGAYLGVGRVQITNEYRLLFYFSLHR